MDVSFLAPVFAATGPFATACADVTHTTENAGTELELRVRAVAERLTEQGAPEAVVEAVRSRLLEGNDGGSAGTAKGRAVGGAPDGSVVLDPALVGRPRSSPRRGATARAPGWPSGRRIPTCCRCCASCRAACRTSSSSSTGSAP